MFTRNLTLVSNDDPATITVLAKASDRSIAVNLCATIARAGRKCLSQVCRLDVAILEVLDRAD